MLQNTPVRFLEDETYYGNGTSSIEFLYLLLLRRPNIERLKYNGSIHFTQLFEQIRLASERWICKHIQYVDGGLRFKSEKNQQVYFDTMYCLRNNLHDLSMTDSFKVQPNTIDSPLQILKEFSALHTLDPKTLE
jgi:hypothetical protein